MLLVAGILLLVLGLLSGALLLLAPLGLIDATAGTALWILFPVFSIGGYLLAAAPMEDSRISVVSRVSGAVLLLLALAAAVALVLQAASMIESRGTASLWYVLVIGLVLGGTGLASHRKLGNT